MTIIIYLQQETLPVQVINQWPTLTQYLEWRVEFGYGQGTEMALLVQAMLYKQLDWTTLLTRNATLASHQGTSITSITNPSAGNTIEAYAALSANVTATFNGKLNAAASGSDASVSSVTTTAWNTSSVLTKTFTFASRNQLRYFFNAGGLIRLSWSRTGGTASSQNTSWTNTLTAAGTIVISGVGTSKTIAGVAYTGITKIGGSGTTRTLLTGTGVLTPIASTHNCYTIKFHLQDMAITKSKYLDQFQTTEQFLHLKQIYQMITLHQIQGHLT